jgi:hypothetical protein
MKGKRIMPRKKTKKQSKTTKANKQIYQTHGKVESFKPTTLDQVWGDTGGGRYGGASLKEYKTELQEMNRTDIQAHATRLHVVPVENREMLEKRLVKEFEKHAASYRKPDSPKPSSVSPEAMRILSEGR